MPSLSAAPPDAALRAGTRLSSDELAHFRRRAIFECDKWDPQVEDTPALAPFPLLLAPGVWQELSALAEALAAETLAAESELLHRPELHRTLGLPRRIVAALRRIARHGEPAATARLARFDFHPTADGWRITEVNSDVPGGLNEAAGITQLIHEFVPGAHPAGDPVEAYAAELVPSSATPHVALVHATAYSDDHQVMRFLARALAARGATPALISPAQIEWRDGWAHLAGGARGALDVLVRFFPAEWLAELPRKTKWQRWFAGGRTTASNPGTALLTQSKRFPLVWDSLDTALPTWRRLLPETRALRDVPWRSGDEWVIKPALGRVGAGVGIGGETVPEDWKAIIRGARRYPHDWVAQRRFAAQPLETEEGVRYPGIGVFTIGTRAVGVYGRLARRPLIDARAQDAAVLLETGS